MQREAAKHQGICRLCLKKLDLDDPDIRCILDEMLQKVFKCVFPFEIQFRTDLPWYTCKQCSWNVMDFYSYMEQVVQNQKKLDKHFCPDQKPAPACNEKLETEKENISLNSNANALPTNSSEEHFADMPMVNCKKEVDEILVTNEIHPDLMDYSYETMAGMNESISCGNYEITSSVPDESTECANSLTICNTLNDKTVVKNEIPGCDSTDNKRVANTDRDVPKKKRKYIGKSKSRKSKTSRTSEELCCNKCGKTFCTERQLRVHDRVHYFETCVICKITFKRQSMIRHMRRKHKS